MKKAHSYGAKMLFPIESNLPCADVNPIILVNSGVSYKGF